MAPRKPAPPVPSTPTEYPGSPPVRELHPTSDIRFVMVEVAKLTTKVDRLVDDVKSHGDKLDKIGTRMTWFSGVAAASALLLAAFFGIFWKVMEGKWDTLHNLLTKTTGS